MSVTDGYLRTTASTLYCSAPVKLGIVMRLPCCARPFDLVAVVRVRPQEPNERRPEHALRAWLPVTATAAREGGKAPGAHAPWFSRAHRMDSQ